MFKFTEDKKGIYECDKNISGKIIIPDGVEWIRMEGCGLVTEIVLPESLTELASSAFADCISLVTVNIPSKISTIVSNAFKGCINLKNINCASKLEKIEWRAFYNCKRLNSFPFSDSIYSIGHEAFYGCFSLENVYLSKKIYQIESKAFYGCASIQNLTVPPNVHVIKEEAFALCDNLQLVSIKSDDIEINPTAFNGCVSLRGIHLTSNPKRTISNFPDCENLKTIYIHSSNESVEKFERDIIQRNHDSDLEEMAKFYHGLKMNLSQMKWMDSKKTEASFKAPTDNQWRNYTKEEQPDYYFNNRCWKQSAGVGLLTGVNNFRALDFDIKQSCFNGSKAHEFNIDELITEVLQELKLPIDYQWVVKSGNGYGFHVIFKCNDNEATAGLDSLSYELNDTYSHRTKNSLIRVELKWADHIVLPPSMHKSGLQYKFWFVEKPNSEPYEVSIHDIDSLLFKLCGDRQFIDCTYGDKKFQLTELRKVKCRYPSYNSEHSHKIDPILWMQQCSSNESTNSLAIRLILKDGIERDEKKALGLLKSLNTQSAIFNLLSLYSTDPALADAKTFFNLYDKLDKNLFSQNLELLKKNALERFPEPPVYLFFDTETNGLPKNHNEGPSNSDNWPRLVQLSWLLVDYSLEVISRKDYVVKPEGFNISDSSAEVHGITNDLAKERGTPLKVVVDKFIQDLDKSSILIGHNVEFDKKVLASELLRLGESDIISSKPSFCTMKATIEYCGIPGPYGLKYPKLQDLYAKLFGEPFKGAHKALSDAMATLKCYKELKSKMIL